MVRILLSFLLLMYCSGAMALRDDLCRSLGKGLEFLSETHCREGNQAEYELACAQVSFGQRYNHGDFRWGNFQRTGYKTLAEYTEAMTDEILMNLAAQNVAESNRCMVNFYGEYLSPDSNASLGVKAAFRLAKPRLEALLPPAGSPRRLSFLRPSSELVNSGRTIDVVKRDSEDGPRVAFDALIASIPLGNQEEIRSYVAKAVVENFSEAQFFAGYKTEVTKLRTKHQRSVDSITVFRVNRDQPVYNVRKGERGSTELRQALIESGAIENYIMANNLEAQFAPGYLCRRHRQDKGCIALTAIEFAGSLALPYAAASIGLRAGLAMAGRGLTTWSTARFVGHAISRGLLFSGYIGQLALLTDDAVGQCLVRHPQYLESKSVATCEPKKMVFEAASEASMAECLNTVALGLAPLGIAAIADDALRALRVESKLDDVAEGSRAITLGLKSEVIPNLSPASEATEIIPDIVVIGNRNRHSDLQNRPAFRNYLETGRYPPAEWAALTKDQKIFAMESLLGKKLTKVQKGELGRLITEQPDGSNLSKNLPEIIYGEAATNEMPQEFFLTVSEYENLSRKYADTDLEKLVNDSGASWYRIPDVDKIYIFEKLSGHSINRTNAQALLRELFHRPDPSKISRAVASTAGKRIVPEDAFTVKISGLAGFSAVDPGFIRETEDYLTLFRDLERSEWPLVNLKTNAHARRMLGNYLAEANRRSEFITRTLARSNLSADVREALVKAQTHARQMQGKLRGYLDGDAQFTYQDFLQATEASVTLRNLETANDLSQVRISETDQDIEIFLGLRPRFSGLYDPRSNSVFVPTDKELQFSDINAFSDRNTSFIGVSFTDVDADGITMTPKAFMVHDQSHAAGGEYFFSRQPEANAVARNIFRYPPPNEIPLRQALWFDFWHEFPIQNGDVEGRFLSYVRNLRDRNSLVYKRLKLSFDNPKDFGSDRALVRSFENDLDRVSRGMESDLLRPLSPSANKEISLTAERIEMMALERNKVEETRIVETLRKSNPRLERGFQRAIEEMNHPDFVVSYVANLQEDAFFRMAGSSSPELVRKGQEGVIDQESVLAVLKNRIEARGQKIVEIAPEDGILADDLFRQKISSGYLIDRGVNSSHGTYSHLVQQDMFFDLICKESGVTQKELFQFLGTEDGKRVWDDMFDAFLKNDSEYGYLPRSLRSPEYMKSVILDHLNLP